MPRRRLTARTSAGATSAGRPRRRTRLEDFFSSRWDRLAWRRRSLPVPVTLKRLAAPLSVFCFGIRYLSGPTRRSRSTAREHCPNRLPANMGPEGQGSRTSDRRVLRRALSRLYWTRRQQGRRRRLSRPDAPWSNGRHFAVHRWPDRPAGRGPRPPLRCSRQPARERLPQREQGREPAPGGRAHSRRPVPVRPLGQSLGRQSLGHRELASLRRRGPERSPRQRVLPMPDRSAAGPRHSWDGPGSACELPSPSGQAPAP